MSGPNSRKNKRAIVKQFFKDNPQIDLFDLLDVYADRQPAFDTGLRAEAAAAAERDPRAVCYGKKQRPIVSNAGYYLVWRPAKERQEEEARRKQIEEARRSRDETSPSTPDRSRLRRLYHSFNPLD